MLDQIKKDLPNFPDEIISGWLESFANQAGWPPPLDSLGYPEGRWKALLVNKPMQYWQSVRWEKVSRHISAQDLDPESLERVTNLVLAAVLDQANLWSIFISDLKPRFESITQYISERGELPCAPVLVKGANGLCILDGNHRIAAYLYCYGYFNIELDAALQLKTSHLQSYWVGEPNLPFNPDPTATIC